MWQQGRWPAVMAVELIKHVHLINFDVLVGMWPPEERSHEIHNEAQNGTNIATALRIFAVKSFFIQKTTISITFWHLFKITDLTDTTQKRIFQVS